MARWNYESCCWLDNDGTPLADYEPTAQDYARMAEDLCDKPREEAKAAIKRLPDDVLIGLNRHETAADADKPEASQ